MPTPKLKVLCFNVCALVSHTAHDDKAHCNNTPIGMESGSIPDQAITFNNTYGGYEARKGRLGHSHTTWCGNDAQSGYMQINLQHLYRICAVATQGGGNYFFAHYALRLSADGATWDFYEENGALKVYLFRIKSCYDNREQTSGMEISDTPGGRKRPCNRLMGVCIFTTESTMIYNGVAFSTE